MRFPARTDGRCSGIHAGGDGRRTAREYADAACIVIRTPAVAATGNGRLAREPAGGIAHVKSVKVRPPRVLCRCDVAALRRCSGGFTAETTFAARRADTPDVSV